MNKNQNRHKIFSNMGWNFGTSVVTQFVQAIVSIILARLILPESYGIIAIVMVIIAFCRVFVDFGLGSALIQKKDATQEDYSSVFYINIMVSAVIYTGLYFLAPIIANFYGDDYPNLTIYIRVIGITIIFLGIRSIQNAYIAKNLLFKKAFRITLLGGTLSGIVGIVLAYILPQEQRIWALIAQTLLSSFLSTVGMWLYIGWRPKFVFSKEAIKPLFRFGWKMLVKGMINVLSANIRKLIIGKVYTSEDLAFYDRGRQYPQLMVKTVDNSIGAVLFPVLANAQDDIARLKKMTRRTLQVTTFLTFPLLAGFACIAPRFVQVVLTDTWLPAVPFLQIFCVVFLFRPLTGIQFRSLLALGRSDITLKCEIIRGVTDVAILGVTIWFGVIWVAIGVLFVVFVEFLIYYLPNKRLINYTFKELVIDAGPPFILMLLMSGATLAVGLLQITPWIVLVLQVSVGAAVYTVLSHLTKNTSYIYILDIIKHKVVRKRNINKNLKDK